MQVTAITVCARMDAGRFGSRCSAERARASTVDAQQTHCAAARARWVDSALVFGSTVGTRPDPRNVLRICHGLLAEAGLERCGFHVSRHTAVSLLIAEGVPLEVIQEVVRHSLLSTTTDIYGHLCPLALGSRQRHGSCPRVGRPRSIGKLGVSLVRGTGILYVIRACTHSWRRIPPASSNVTSAVFPA